MQHCKSYEFGDPYLYTYYIQGFLIPYLDDLRDQQKLKLGTKEILIPNQGTFIYNGELDDKGKACGKGSAVNQKLGIRLEGTWLNDKAHGISK